VWVCVCVCVWVCGYVWVCGSVCGCGEQNHYTAADSMQLYVAALYEVLSL